MGRRGGDAEVRWRVSSSGEGYSLSHIHVWQIKIRRDMLGASDPSPRPDYTAQGSDARKINPCNSLLEKPVEVGAAEKTPLKGPTQT